MYLLKNFFGVVALVCISSAAWAIDANSSNITKYVSKHVQYPLVVTSQSDQSFYLCGNLIFNEVSANKMSYVFKAWKPLGSYSNGTFRCHFNQDTDVDLVWSSQCLPSSGNPGAGAVNSTRRFNKSEFVGGLPGLRTIGMQSGTPRTTSSACNGGLEAVVVESSEFVQTQIYGAVDSNTKHWSLKLNMTNGYTYWVVLNKDLQ